MEIREVLVPTRYVIIKEDGQPWRVDTETGSRVRWEEGKEVIQPNPYVFVMRGKDMWRVNTETRSEVLWQEGVGTVAEQTKGQVEKLLQ